ncbi:Stk1 family PASTA domain-containing Ser/Thr kinase, partial [Jatrophihabitans sp.]|uniref:Stk1 family PASTA domain-containing Ser/Thr kinase n=1 Tax=Jatrophihabitans sp. TaxID=1932789 RepID=UPI0030C742A2|nr:spk [Jatrophihabitans sp.]
TLEGRYRILDRIARGGMSTVYEAVDERLDRLVAVKVMSAALSADPAFSDRFAREARAAARLTHVNAVAVYDQGQDDTDGHHVFLVMELVEGRTLRDLIRQRGGAFTPAESISIMEPVLAALAAAHRAGLVHRDVKPENILLSDDGLVKVADFGLARAVDSDAASTRTGLMMGTVAYCAPEQIVQGQADQRSDVYAAGIVLFELLTGRPPYTGDSAMNVAYQHVHSRVPAPSSRVKGIPNEIDELVIAATDSDASSRPADAGAFLAEIAEIRADLDLPIMPIPTRPRAPRLPTPPATNVRPPAQDTSRTDVLAGPAPRHDTQVVPHPSGPSGPPPPVVTPMSAAAGGKGGKPPKGKVTRTPRQRRRRRTIIGLSIVLLLAIASTVGGIKAVDWYRSWNSHIPAVSGESLVDAKAELASAHYKVGAVTPQYSETVRSGVIISTDPAAGSRLQRGKVVSLVVSQGEHMVAVPDVANLSQNAAQTALTNRGLQFGPTPTTKSSQTVKKGLVIGTDPAAGKSVKFGSAVTLIVSTGLPMVQVPSLSDGESFEDFSKALTDKKFKVNETQQYSDSVDAGNVISYSPQDQEVQGTTVNVVVSKGPQYVQVPKITRGESSEDAVAALQAAGLVPKLDKSFDGGVLDRVLSVSPGSGKTVQIGSTVKLIIV